MLKILPPNISNLIAAGEVVQRPASAVKELLENAVDAGAGNISVIIEDSGKTLIQVIDDGCGMTPDEARLCFERHATSKISEAADLSAIMTYGFSVAQDNFEKAGVRLTTLCDYDTLIAQAAEMHYVQPSDLELLARWRENPSRWKKEDGSPPPGG